MISKKRWLLSVVLVVLVTVTACQSQDEMTRLAESEHEGNGGFLWEVVHGDTTVYLQGTIHIGQEDFFPLNTASEAAYKRADVILPEIDLNALDIEEIQPMTMELALYEDGSKLQDHISPELYNDITELLSMYGFDMQMIENLRPWYVEMILTEMIAADAGYDTNYSVDQYFLDRADEDGKEVQALENFEDQLQMFANFSPQLQEETLSAAVNDREELVDEYTNLVSYWLDGDVEGMLDMETENEEFDGYQEYMSQMNDARNMEMAAQIQQIFEENSGQTYMVIVGTMHFILEPSIVSLLEDEGYDVVHVY
ncbi:hypothetical protein GI584_01655 [Gracilibacillus salitolerans]|uniref:TraB/GumN family protein n=1 Tax=Gracilibacillus salitolerans TaxID=2663022 RepID=A0A5Q2TDY3_9BACI|nr:TraB/GumN family protein [Gracilibacillus salitolerans]QGH32835.1 hypothetical protein GI584_01655 [Gracilibacillus salitolerans]